LNKFTKGALLFLGYVAVCFVVTLIINSLFLDGGLNPFDYGLDEIDTVSWVIFGLLVFIGVIYMLNKESDGNIFSGKPKDKRKSKPTEQFFDTEWLSDGEFDKKYDGCSFRDLGNKKDGVPLRAELKGGTLHVNLLHQVWHTLVIGTTGTGKTQGLIHPTIQLLSHTKTRPSLLVMDVKSEIAPKQERNLKAQGYDVMSFDLREPYNSVRWNPLTKPYKAYVRAHNLKKEVIIHRNESPASCGCQVISHSYGKEWYEFEKVAYPTREAIEERINALSVQLQNSAFDDLKDIAMTLCPVSEGTNDTTWQQGAQEFILGILLCMLEDSTDPRLGMTQTKYNFFNLYQICSTRDPNPDKPFGSIIEYLNGRDKLSKGVALAAPIVNNAPGTAKSFFGIISSAVSCFSDNGVCYATSYDDMDFSRFADKPTALFVKVPFEKENRHAIGQLMMISLYKTLVEQSTTKYKGELPRHCYFLLDEFANMPKLSNIQAMLTVSRGIGISLMLVVQDYAQLTDKYSESIAEIIKSNSNVHIYLGTGNQKTKEEFSTRIGQTSVEVKTTGKSKTKSETTKSTNVQKVSRALITPDELGYLKEGEMIVSVFREKPIRSTFTFSYKVPMYNMNPLPEKYVAPKYLDEKAVFYDIRERNKIVLKGTPGNDDDYFGF